MKPALVLLSLLLPAAGADSPPLAIRNARVVTVSGPVLSKGTVLVRDGLIAAVGASVDIPKDAWIIEGEGLTVYPGLIDALSNWGIPDAAPAATTATPRAAAQARRPSQRSSSGARGTKTRP
jgi:imidazolonepropionase-like amidohydrolase